MLNDFPTEFELAPVKQAKNQTLTTTTTETDPQLSVNDTRASDSPSLPRKFPKKRPSTTPSASTPHFGGADQGLMLDHVLYQESHQLSGIFDAVQLPPDAVEQLSPEAVKLMSLSALLRLLSPAFLILLWYNFWQTLNLFLDTKNKNWRDYRNFTVSTLTTVGWTLLYACNLAVIGTALAHAAPYILLVVLSVKALSGFVKCIENLYYFAKTKDKEFLWEATKELMGVVTYTFGLVLTIVLGMELEQINNNIHAGLNDLDNGGQDLIFASLDSLSAVFSTFEPMIKGLIGLVFIRTMIDVLDYTYKINRDTLRDFKSNHLSDAFHDALNEAYHHPLRRGIPLFFKGIGKIVSLPFLIFYPAITWVIEKARSKASTQKANATQTEDSSSVVSYDESIAASTQKNSIATSSALTKRLSQSSTESVSQRTANTDERVVDIATKNPQIVHRTQRFFSLANPKLNHQQKKHDTATRPRSRSDEAGTLLLHTPRKVPTR